MPHILLVEDDSDIMRVNRTFLENEGYTVHCADSVQKAEFQLEECVPDLVLLDVMLPDGDGMDFCAVLRKKNTGSCYIPYRSR
ncbi:MAG TPA: response regulator [Ruminococcus sp.]|nr:response regulator [Ruminococcus sp.]